MEGDVLIDPNMERNFREEQDSREDGSFYTRWRQPETAGDPSHDALGEAWARGLEVSNDDEDHHLVHRRCRVNVASAC